MFVTRASILIVLFALALGHYYYWTVRGDILAAEKNHYFGAKKNGLSVAGKIRAS